jgi:hypothetical protein
MERGERGERGEREEREKRERGDKDRERGRERYNMMLYKKSQM